MSDDVRARSIAAAEALGFPRPPVHLPLLDDVRVRQESEVVDRIAVLSAVAAVAHGCPHEAATQWLADEGLGASVTQRERAFLAGDSDALRDEARGRPEAIFALAWAVSLFAEPLDFASVCPPSLIHSVPHPPPRPNPVADARSRGRLRPIDDLAAALDLAFCLHWVLVDSRLSDRDRPGALEEWIVVERRRALEWLLGPDEWDDVDLST